MLTDTRIGICLEKKEKKEIELVELILMDELWKKLEAFRADYKDSLCHMS